VYDTPTKNITTSRHKKAHAFVDLEEKFLISGEETEAGRTRRRGNKHNTTSRLNAELGRQAEGEVWAFRELNAEETLIFQNTTLDAAQNEELE
jgi:hypothetical protein